jgi:hypothetical protein
MSPKAAAIVKSLVTLAAGVLGAAALTLVPAGPMHDFMLIVAGGLPAWVLGRRPGDTAPEKIEQ